RERDADEREEIRQREEVRRDAGVNTRCAGIVGLSEDVREGEEAREPERGPERDGRDVLSQTMTLETEIRDPDADEREGRVEDRHRVRDRVAVAGEQPREEQRRLIEQSG